MIRDGEFRDDLYYRLNVIEIGIPPLRARVQDIPLLVDFFIRKFALANGKEQVVGVTEDTLAALLSYFWPGNVRELEHAIERAVILARESRLDRSLFPALPPAVSQPPRTAGPSVPGSTLEEIEKNAILRTLESVSGSTARAAAILKISPRTIQYKIKQYRSEGATVGRHEDPQPVCGSSRGERSA